MSPIRVLPDHLINQIAAGEVIERPASVIKELLENAIDAGATQIEVDLLGGGRRGMRVADDGCGMSRDDALLALERHATSKLSGPEDLARIRTLGFRGEALPAIASVSRLTLTTSPDGIAGTRVEVEGGVIRSRAGAGHPRGTTLDVRDLFFNTPARAKFLKGLDTELGHILTLVTASAVAVPGIGMRVSHEGRVLAEAPQATEVLDRIVTLFGPDWKEAHVFEETQGALGVRGVIAPPESSASSRRLQHLYVNGRLVRDRLLGHAVSAACEGFLPRGRYARLFLFLTCPPESVDVNVHPAKAEVRFRDPRVVHDRVHGVLVAALRSARPYSTLIPGGSPEGDVGSVPESGRLGELPARWNAPDRPAAGVSAWDPAALQSFWQGPGTSAESVEAPAVLAHYRESYIVASDEEGLLLVDQHAAHERILFERLVRSSEGTSSEPLQDLLFPVTVQVPQALRPRLEQAAQELEALGLGAEPFGQGTLMIRAVPGFLGGADPARLAEELLEQMVADGRDWTAGVAGTRERLLATVACHAAIKVRMPLTPEKMNYLIHELFRTVTPMKCPHGRPAVVRLPHRDLERSFLRP